MSHSIRKQLLLILLAVALVLSLAVVFTACNKQHEHAFSTEWTTDADYHWHEATCNDTREVKDRGQHSFNEDWKCTLCNYQHEHTFSEEWNSNGTNHWHKATCEHEDEKSDMNAHSYGEDGKCTVCGYQKPIVSEHQHSYSEQWTTDSDYHWHEATCEHEGEINDLGAHLFGDDGKCAVCGYEKPAEPKHEHTYSDWLGDADGENHYKLPTCDDTDEMVGPFPHVDEDGDGACDVCLTTNIHKHSFSAEWSYDGEGHWKAATCKHSELKSEYAEHVDEDGNGYGDGVCDICGYSELYHEHKFEEEWTINESVHWHVAICIHFLEKGSYAAHSFNGKGVCECGVEKNYVEVYGLYKKTGNLTFVEWLRWLEDKGVVRVEKTESGDGIYYYKDGTNEFAFLGDRTVKVKAVDTEGNPLAHVWLMVAEFRLSNGEYVAVNGKIALGLAETNDNGEAIITFSPVDGYSTSNINYRLRVAEAKDIASYLGIDEGDVKPIPNRYSLAEGFEYSVVDVSENASNEDVVALTFRYSAGWNAYDKFYLPYRRYYTDMLHAEGLVEEGFEYEHITSGNNLFDYFYFSPQKYDFSQGSNPEENRIIENNAKIAASGIYRISFTVEGNATAVLYFWDEGGVHLDGAGYMVNADGTPANSYITAISGEGNTDKYTGGNFIEFEIATEVGLRLFQFGIKSDVECKVIFTVERTGDYDPNKPDYGLQMEAEGKYSVSDATLISYEVTRFALPEVPAGVYTLTVTPIYEMNKYAGMLYAYTDEDNRVSLWEGTGANGTSAKRQPKGIISINEGDSILCIISSNSKSFSCTVTLEKYEVPVFNADGEYAYLPATPESLVTSYEIPLSATPGEYTLEIIVYTNISEDGKLPMKVKIGEKAYTIDLPSIYGSNNIYDLTYKTSVTVGNQDTTISLICGMSYSLTARVKLTAVA